MPSWWGKSSSKETKKRPGKESFIDSLQRKLKGPSENKVSEVSWRHCNDTASEIGSSLPSPSKKVSRCQSFAERPNAQPLPLPGLRPSVVSCTDSGISESTKPRSERNSKPSLFLPLPTPACICSRPSAPTLDGDLVTGSVSSECSLESDVPTDLRCCSLQETVCDTVNNTASASLSSVGQATAITQLNYRDRKKPEYLSFNDKISSTAPKRRPLGNHVKNIQVPPPGAFCRALESSFSSPSRSPIRAYGTEQILNVAWGGKPYHDVTLIGSGHCSSPGSGHNSGHNSMGGDMSGQLFWQQSRSSPEYSPVPSPRLTSPGPSSRVQSGAVTPIHPREGAPTELLNSRPEEKQSHCLPLPPIGFSGSSPLSHPSSAVTSPSLPRSPGRAETPASPGSRWKKGKLVGRGTFGHVYVGFNSESGEMCAMKEVTIFSEDAKSKESAKQLMQEIVLLSRLWHPNIVQYYGSETVDDKLYIYLEYVSGGSIHKLLQDYGQFGELAIRSYTQQILSGIKYLHAKNTVHRDIKGANILVDPNGRVKLADFGMAKHISVQSCPLSFKGSPYWMAPEVIKNSNGCNLAVDIWSLGCTVLEMATSKPPWSEYEGVAAMFKIGNGKELPAIPEYLSIDVKDFVKQCLQRNPLHRPTAAQLLEHPFVKYAAPIERPILAFDQSDLSPMIANGVKAMDIGQERNHNISDSDKVSPRSTRSSKVCLNASEIHMPRNIFFPVSPIGSPLLNAHSPQYASGRMSPSPICSPRTISGSSTPLTGGSCAIPYNHLKHSICIQEGFGSMSKSTTNSFHNHSSLHHDSNLDIFHGIQPGSCIFSEFMMPENDVLKQAGRPLMGEPYDGQSVFADRVSQQLLRDSAQANFSWDLLPTSPLSSRMDGY